MIKDAMSQRQTGNNNVQIGIQNNGLTVENATQMAFQIFREHFPQFKEEMLSSMRELLFEYLKDVPQDNIGVPKPRYVIPVLENASITDELEIRKLYAKLLANSMNNVVKNDVHPSFVEIIKQLCPDEAKILKYVSEHHSVPTITLRFENEKSYGIDAIVNFSNIGELTECENPYSIDSYFCNLIRLGLLQNPQGVHLENKDLYTPLKNHKYIISKQEEIYQFDILNKINFVESLIAITPFGEQFCRVCIDRRT